MLHGELLVPGLIFVAIGIALIALAQLWPVSRPASVNTLAPLDGMPAIDVSQMTGPVVPFERAITWPARIDPDAGELDENERRHIIEGLGIVGDVWAAEILAQAFEEEDDDLRVAALEALGVCESEIVEPTLERAYHSYAISERYAAIDNASRRADVPLLERALHDTEGTIALAAAYGLHRAGRDDLIDRDLADREDARANEIRHLLPLLV